MKIVQRAWRITVGTIALWVVALIASQYLHLVTRDIALAHQVADARANVQTLQARRDRQVAEIQRLEDPRGAVPEIHRLLGLFAPNERQIFLRGPGGIERSPEESP